MGNTDLRKLLAEKFDDELRVLKRLVDMPPKHRRTVRRQVQKKFVSRIDELSAKIDDFADQVDAEVRLLRRDLIVNANALVKRPSVPLKKLSTRFDEITDKIDDLSLRLEDELRTFRANLLERPLGGDGPNGLQAIAARFDDEVRFLKTWVENPLTLGAVSPSSPFLARAMAEMVEPTRPGVIIELGPGTGSVTRALVERGVDPERLVAVEYDPDFCELIANRFPGITVVEGDAYNLKATLGRSAIGPVSAIVSGLPLFNKPLTKRLQLLNQGLAMLPPGAPFIQFSYHLLPPIPKEAGPFSLTGSKRIWRNIPPARVWCYRKLAA